MRTSLFIQGVLAAAAIGAPLLAHADSSTQTGTGPLSATAHVDFQITIPKFLFLRVGTAASVDQITWAPAAGVVGNGTAQAGTGGDLNGGVQSAVVIGNSGNVVLAGATSGPLNDGAGDTISYAQIKLAVSTNTTTPALTPATLQDGATTSTTLNAVNKIVQQDAKWTWSYANTTVPPAGTYGGGGAGNVGAGRVTYTASVP